MGEQLNIFIQRLWLLSIGTVILNLSLIDAVAQTPFPDASLPTNVPGLFAERVLTDGLVNRDFAISPDGNEIFVTIQHPKFLSSAILYLRKSDGKWSNPEVASFSGSYRDLEASFSFDGRSVYFSSDRPVGNSGEAKKDFDLWKVVRLQNGEWGEPEHLGQEVNSVKNEFYPVVTKIGNLYFTVEAEKGKGKEDIVVSQFVNNRYMAPESLSDSINSAGYEFNAFVDPDEKYVIFTAYGRKDDLGQGDLYISRKDKSGSWAAAKHLPFPINSNGLDYCPFVTLDQRYLIFTSNRIGKHWGETDKKSYETLKKNLSNPGNGYDDLYWVKFEDSF